MQQLTGQAYVERYGHAWNDPSLAREYVERTDRDAMQREDGFRVMVSLIPFAREGSIRVLDVGTGQGAVAALVLDAFPNARAVGLDVSEPMRDIANERMAAYGERFRYQLGDFIDGDLPAEFRSSFEAVVSSRAIHHLPAEKKRRLYAAIYGALTPGGCFLNLDGILPSDPYLRARYRDAGRILRGEPVDADPDRGSRAPTPGHYCDTVGEHLGFLRDAGFEAVDCFWKRLGMTLLGGYRRA